MFLKTEQKLLTIYNQLPSNCNRQVLIIMNRRFPYCACNGFELLKICSWLAQICLSKVLRKCFWTEHRPTPSPPKKSYPDAILRMEVSLEGLKVRWLFTMIAETEVILELNKDSKMLLYFRSMFLLSSRIIDHK